MERTIQHLRIIPHDREALHYLNVINRHRVNRGRLAAGVLDTSVFSHDTWRPAASFVANGLGSENLMDTISLDELLEYVDVQCVIACSVPPPQTAMREFLSALCESSVEPSKFLGQTILRCSAMANFLGEHLCCKPRASLQVDLFGFPAHTTFEDTPSELLKELLQAREEIYKLQTQGKRTFDILADPCLDVKKSPGRF